MWCFGVNRSVLTFPVNFDALDLHQYLINKAPCHRRQGRVRIPILLTSHFHRASLRVQVWSSVSQRQGVGSHVCTLFSFTFLACNFNLLARKLFDVRLRLIAKWEHEIGAFGWSADMSLVLLGLERFFGGQGMSTRSWFGDFAVCGRQCGAFVLTTIENFTNLRIVGGCFLALFSKWVSGFETSFNCWTIFNNSLCHCELSGSRAGVFIVTTLELGRWDQDRGNKKRYDWAQPRSLF